MITLFLTAFDQLANQREFNCQLTSIEANFDLLNSIVAQGHILSAAYIIEDERRTDLPLEAFDGLPCSKAIQALEKKWKKILSRPGSFDLIHQQELIELTRRRIEQCDATILACQQMTHRINAWIQQTQVRTLPSPKKSQLIERYEGQLVTYQVHLVKTRFFAALAKNRLGQLMT